MFLALALRGRKLGIVARQWAVFCCGMGLAILPWTVRDYVVNGAVIHLRNCAANFLSLNLDIGTVVLREFESAKEPGTSVDHLWFTPGHSADALPSRCAGRFLVFIWILTILAAVGVVLALRGRDRRLLVAGATYLCLCLAHTFTFMDVMY